jgi:hypothetical protein
MPDCGFRFEVRRHPFGPVARRPAAARARRAVEVTLLVPAITVLVLGACTKSHTRFKHPRFMSEQDCAACVEVALEAPSPDARREAVVHVAKTKYLTDPVVIRALATIARSDESASVRFASVRALTRAGEPADAEPLLAIALEDEDFEDPSDRRYGRIRAAAVQGLDTLSMTGAISDIEREECESIAIGLLRGHRARDVRIAAAAILRHSQSVATLNALIDALDQRDFGVVYESERSLIHLTGQCHNYSAVAWREWLASASDPFRDAGRLDYTLEPEDEGWWDRTVDAARRTVAGFRGK